ncbi:MAG: 2-amino-4-hydroxy-6-hydroxymethyldihydropteridine diphosphokinase, partial [Candidatus Dormibacteria bacterium]
MADRIELHGLRCLGTHGVSAEERSSPQPFEVDLDVACDLTQAGESDELDDTIDYAALCTAVSSVVEGAPTKLLEHLAQRISDEVMRVGGERVLGVRLSVRKLRPPVPVDLAWSAVTISRSRQQTASAARKDDEPSTPRYRRAFIGLGSNLGDRREALAGAISALPDVVAASPIYETDPVGGPPGSGPFLNCVVELFTALSPRDLMEAGQAAEKRAGRTRGQRWGPRTLDVDVLLVGDLVVEEPDLVVPHPRMWE